MDTVENPATTAHRKPIKRKVPKRKPQKEHKERPEKAPSSEKSMKWVLWVGIALIAFGVAAILIYFLCDGDADNNNETIVDSSYANFEDLVRDLRTINEPEIYNEPNVEIEEAPTDDYAIVEEPVFEETPTTENSAPSGTIFEGYTDSPDHIF